MSRKKERVAFQGERGAFSQVAVHQLLGAHVEVVPCQRFDEAFGILARGKVDAAVIPVENTLHGSVHENYDNLLKYKLPIVAETNVRIVHNLIALPGVRTNKIRRVYSHPVALNQCLKFFADRPNLERVPFYDTAGSVKMLVEERPPDAAAIASEVAAEIYGAKVLRRSIEDDRLNFTRFVLLRGKKAARELPKAGKTGYKTSLVFATCNEPGYLFRALSVFALRDINLAKIESRPLRGKPWEYLFYLDLHGRIDDEPVKRALGHLSELTDFQRVLGCYPRTAETVKRPGGKKSRVRIR
jgi:prephenate dehydratase